MNRICRFFKKNIRTIIILIVIISVIAVVFCFFTDSREIISNVADIIAVPAMLLSLIVLDNIVIDRDNLDAYYNKRLLVDNKYKILKKETIALFDKELKSVQISVKEDYNRYSNKVKNKEKVNPQTVNICSQELDKIKSFFDNTKDFIIWYIEKKYRDSGEVDRIDRINTNGILLDRKQIETLGEEIEKLNDRYFTSKIENIDDVMRNTLEVVFLDKENGYRKYLDLCSQIYSMIGEDNNV